jgi:hypothetical protein
MTEKSNNMKRQSAGQELKEEQVDMREYEESARGEGKIEEGKKRT